jgi:hypothetical protein
MIAILGIVTKFGGVNGKTGRARGEWAEERSDKVTINNFFLGGPSSYGPIIGLAFSPAASQHDDEQNSRPRTCKWSCEGSLPLSK